VSTSNEVCSALPVHGSWGSANRVHTEGARSADNLRSGAGAVGRGQPGAARGSRSFRGALQGHPSGASALVATMQGVADEYSDPFRDLGVLPSALSEPWRSAAFPEFADDFEGQVPNDV